MNFICNALRDLVPFVQSKKYEKKNMKECKFTINNYSSMCVFLG